MRGQSFLEEIIPVSRTSTELQKTGLWGKLKPVYEEGIGPCRYSCPLGNDIPLFLSYIKEGDFGKAKEVLLFENPFPGICGRVCQSPCEKRCNRGEYDWPISIRALERFAGEYPLYSVPVSISKNPKRIAIVGAGPCGLSCAYFLLRLGHNVTIFDKWNDLGGLLRYGIPAYRLPKQILDRDLKVLYGLHPDLRLGRSLTKDDVLSLLDSFDYVLLAPGLWKAKNLSAKGIEKDGVHYGFNFLIGEETLKREIKKAIVIGGGDVAMDVARTIRRIRPQAEVKIFAPEKLEELPALEENVQETKEEGIEIVGGYIPVSFEGRNYLRAVVFQATEVGRDADTGELVFKLMNDRIEEPTDIAVICVGQVAGEELKIEGLFDKRGLITVDQKGRSSLNRVYAGGDIVGQKASVSHAIASGKKVAIAIDMEAKGLEIDLKELTLGEDGAISFKKYLGLERKNLKKVIGFSELNTILIEGALQLQVKKEEPLERILDFREVTDTIGTQEAISESKRCLLCGQCRRCDLCFYLCPDISISKRKEGLYEVDRDHCKSCGICAKTCPSHVIELVENESTALG